ncbi:MAG: type II toxin-antitoxin system HicB family antitoxin [Clostridia bacterium]
MKYVYLATVHPESVDGGYSIWFEGLRGCAAQGECLVDALDAAADALAGWLYTMQKHDHEIPDPLTAEQIPLAPGEFVSYVVADVEAYRRFVESYSVRKNLTIPSWLNEKAEAAHVNYSQLLQEALQQRLGLL